MLVSDLYDIKNLVALGVISKIADIKFVIVGLSTVLWDTHTIYIEIY